MFACVYNTLITGTMFYLPSGHVRNTAEVEMDYISHMKLKNAAPTGITYNGINIGIRKTDNGAYVPLTILISSNSNIEEYVRKEDLKIIRKVTVTDSDNNVVEERSYHFEI